MDVAATLAARTDGGLEPDPERVVTVADELDVFAHPVRRDLLAFLARNEAAIGQMAGALEVPRANLYHHLERLIECGLVDLSREVAVGRMKVRYYRAVAERFRVDLTVPDDPP